MKNCFDELPQFSEEVYRFVSAWNRTADPNQRCRIIGTGNPPSKPEEEWIIRYWAPWLDAQHKNPAEPCELRWFAAIDGKDVEVESGTPFKHGKEMIQPRSRTFIPAKLDDNPILEASGYRATLQGLPEPLRSQLLYGDMNAGREDDDWQVIPTEWVKRSMRNWTEFGDREGQVEEGAPIKMLCASADPAMGGSDRLAVGKRYNNWIAKVGTFPGRDLKDGDAVVGKIMPFLGHAMYMPIIIDMLNSCGGSTVTAFKHLFPQVTIYRCNFGERSHYMDVSGKMGMVNIRDECYWRLREALDPSLKNRGPRLLLPQNDDLLTELTAVRWKPSGGKVKCELKDEIRSRIGRSPDMADAVAMLMLGDNLIGNRWVAFETKKASEGVMEDIENNGRGIFGIQSMGTYRGGKGFGF